jgi:hypothetical protein
MTSNPYSPPAVDVTPSERLFDGDHEHTLSEIARATFLAWERLRIIYIGVVGVFTLLFAGPNLVRFGTLVAIFEGAVVANICYFAGPTVETYVRWLGYQGNWVRWAMFIGGTLLTSLLAVISMVSMFAPN